jgi:hypothetical protein
MMEIGSGFREEKHVRMEKICRFKGRKQCKDGED